jgi:hypothetical protein
MNARRAPKLTKICRLARWGLVSVLLPSYAFADAPCNVSGAPAGVLYMTVEAKITSNTATKNGDVTCDGASVANHTCFNVGDKQIQGLMLKGAKAPSVFPDGRGVAVKRALSRSSMEFARTGWPYLCHGREFSGVRMAKQMNGATASACLLRAMVESKETGRHRFRVSLRGVRRTTRMAVRGFKAGRIRQLS